jgi:hypothetical protein
MRMVMMGAALFAGIFMALPAQAQIQLEIGPDGLRIDGDCNPRYENCERYRDDRYSERRRFCTENRALDKAERMGIRRARVEHAGRRTIEVRGRDRYGDRIYVTFGRDRHCPVLRRRD